MSKHPHLVNVEIVARLANVSPELARQTAHRCNVPITKHRAQSFVDGDDVAMLLGMMHHERQQPDGDL